MCWVLGRWVVPYRSYFGSRPRLSELSQQDCLHSGQATRSRRHHRAPILTPPVTATPSSLYMPDAPQSASGHTGSPVDTDSEAHSRARQAALSNTGRLLDEELCTDETLNVCKTGVGESGSIPQTPATNTLAPSTEPRSSASYRECPHSCPEWASSSRLAPTI